MKKTKTIMIGTLVTLMLTGCCMSHDWEEATCTEPKTCSKCEETEGDSLGHTWTDATCSTPKTCSVCGETEGEALEHTWLNATCAEPKHCSVCGETEGEALEHTWLNATCAEPKHCSICGETEGETLEHTLTEANYQQPATCEVCGETVGKPLTAYFETEGWTCDGELNISYPYTVFCIEGQDYTTTGTSKVSDYTTFASDETHEAMEGYEWQTFTITLVFNDDNAHNYGATSNLEILDYYSLEASEGDFDTNYTINYNGMDYDKCIMSAELSPGDGWIDGNLYFTYYLTARVPQGYDGLVVGFYGINNNTYVRLK